MFDCLIFFDNELNNIKINKMIIIVLALCFVYLQNFLATYNNS